jgi:hypothetical protein
VNTPTINVNLAYDPREPHADESQILIPCPIPRSVTVKVPLGACQCRIAGRRALIEFLGAGDSFPGGINAWHDFDCPARPVKVSCDIGGATWDGSKPVTFDLGDGTADLEHVAEPPLSAIDACRERWALVKALVMGMDAPKGANHDHLRHLFAQRDAVYAALADMARAEKAQCDARDRLHKAMNLPAHRRLAPELRESAIELAAFVEHLIEQVGVLP